MNSYEHMNTCLWYQVRPGALISAGGSFAASFAALASITVAHCEQRNRKLKLAV